MLSSPDRGKLIRSGFKIFRRNEQLKTITECRGDKGGWYNVGSYKSKAEMNRAMDVLLSMSSMNIEDK
ncbi:MAG TPA: hypothetical protein PLI62_14190 [Spirochaetota bacterium]|nr:hypothetical protein [Spirochaetota bacterium]